MIETKRVEYKEEIITIKMRDVVNDQFVQREPLACVAYVDGKPTGLAYYIYTDDGGDAVYSLTHVPAGCSVLGNEYDMGSEDAMKHWIELCLEFADWTGAMPRITTLSRVLKYASIGAREEA